MYDRTADQTADLVRGKLLADRQAGLALRLTALDFAECDEVEALLLRLGA